MRNIMNYSEFVQRIAKSKVMGLYKYYVYAIVDKQKLHVDTTCRYTLLMLTKAIPCLTE